jgi:enamine deaminase RidA (YjgF/YER057c/UK114 family)
MGCDASGTQLLTRYTDAPGGPEQANTSYDWVASMEAPVGAQALAIYDRYRRALSAEGGLDQLLRYHIYQRDKHFFSVFDRIRRSFESRPPASTAVGLGRFEPTDRATLCVDAIALRAAGEKMLGRRTVLPGAAHHTAAATFSHVIGAGELLFLAGQIPIDASRPGSPLIRNYEDVPEQGRFLRVGRSHEDARNGPIAAQTWFTYDLIRQHLEANGSSMDHVLNVLVYLQDMRDFPVFHRVHERFFGARPPALTVIEAAEVGHKGTLIEIEPTAVKATSGTAIQAFNPRDWRAPARMSACVSAHGLAFFSGVIGESAIADSAHAQAGGRHALQATAAMAELGRRFAAAGRSLAHIAHLTVYVDDILQFQVIERVLTTSLENWRPALTVLEMPAVAPVPGACLALTAIGWFGDGRLEPQS